MGHSSQAGHPFHPRLLERSERISKETAGRMKLSIFPASQLGGDNDPLSQARSGAVDFVRRFTRRRSGSSRAANGWRWPRSSCPSTSQCDPSLPFSVLAPNGRDIAGASVRTGQVRGRDRPEPAVTVCAPLRS
jgi:hypothetical protein